MLRFCRRLLRACCSALWRLLAYCVRRFTSCGLGAAWARSSLLMPLAPVVAVAPVLPVRATLPRVPRLLRALPLLALSGRYSPIHLNYAITNRRLAFPLLAEEGPWKLYEIRAEAGAAPEALGLPPGP